MPLKFHPKFDKIVELLLYLAHKRPDADKYQAVKFFYLADLLLNSAWPTNHHV